MGSVSSVNPGVADLLDKLSRLDLPVLSSSRVTSALENAPTADIVRMSMAATQLEGVDAMFGISDGSGAGTNSSLANLGDLLTGSAAANSKASSADRLAIHEAALQLTEARGLFGSGSTGSLSGFLIDLKG
jgi:hypothetical protein